MEFFLNGDTVIFGKLLLALVLGLALGFERTIAGKTAGMRTYALVAMGSCLLIIVAQSVTAYYIGSVNFDPMRLASGIVMGIGFICGGLIVFSDNRLTGLTTAAGMWVATAIGIAVGYGLFSIAIFASILTLFTFTFLWKIEELVRQFSDENIRD